MTLQQLVYAVKIAHHRGVCQGGTVTKITHKCIKFFALSKGLCYTYSGLL